MSDMDAQHADGSEHLQQAEIEIEKLADLVYRLMREDARLERARGADMPGRRCH